MTMAGSTQIKGYSFDDEVIDRFCYDSEQHIIELDFSGYFKGDTVYDKPCRLIIEKWKSAKIRFWNETKFHDFHSKLGIISMLLSVEKKDSTLEIWVSYNDQRAAELFFEMPTVQVLEL